MKEVNITNSPLFVVKDNKLEISADALTIPALFYVWNDDQTNAKYVAIKCIAIAYWATHDESPYIDEKLITRVSKLFIDYNIKPTEKSKDYVKRLLTYFEETKSVKRKLYNSASAAVLKVSKYLDSLEFGTAKDADTLNAVKVIVSVINNVEDLTIALDSAKARLNTENVKENKSKLRSGGDINNRER